MPNIYKIKYLDHNIHSNKPDKNINKNKLDPSGRCLRPEKYL